MVEMRADELLETLKDYKKHIIVQLRGYEDLAYFGSENIKQSISESQIKIKNADILILKVEKIVKTRPEALLNVPAYLIPKKSKALK